MSLPSYYELYDEDSYTQFIKDVLNGFRKSPEYKMWLTTTNNETCPINGLNKDQVKIEVHHFGKTLWDIVADILDYFIQNDIRVNTFYICFILAELHFNECIDYIPLTQDLHHMIHHAPRTLYQLYPDFDSYVTRGNMELKKLIIKQLADNMKFKEYGEKEDCLNGE